MADHPSRDRALLWLQAALFGAAALLLGAWAAVNVEARLYDFFEGRRLDRMVEATNRVRSESARRAERPPRSTGQAGKPRRSHAPASPAPELPPVPHWTEIAPADLVGRLEIPRLHVRAIIAEGVDSGTLRRAVGHLPGSAMPGETGNVVIAGHRDTFFRALKDARPDDVLRITTPQGRFEYVVQATAVVEPTRTDVLLPTSEPSMTLVTCYPFFLIGNAPDRFVVRARLLE